MQRANLANAQVFAPLRTRLAGLVRLFVCLFPCLFALLLLYLLVRSSCGPVGSARAFVRCIEQHSVALTKIDHVCVRARDVRCVRVGVCVRMRLCVWNGVSDRARALVCVRVCVC